MELPRWNHKPLHCMVCAHPLPLHRRAVGSWFCSSAHERDGQAQGIVDRAETHRTKADWDHDRNPVNATSCYFCGYRIGMVRRMQGHIYCSEECYLAHHIHQSSEPNTGRRDALIATGVMGVAGAMLMLDRQRLPGPRVAVSPLSKSTLPLFQVDAAPRTHEAALSFKTEDGLKLWLAARDTWRAAGDAMQPIASVLYAGIQEFRTGMVELTTRGGAGMMVSATPDLSSYHFVAFRPLHSAGGIVDYSLDYGTRTDARLVNSSSRRLRLPLSLASRPEATFRLEKKGHNLEAYFEIEPGNRRWLNKWEEKTLADGRVGLYVGESQRYSVVAGRIQADDAL
jgi:hypothetical protein